MTAKKISQTATKKGLSTETLESNVKNQEKTKVYQEDKKIESKKEQNSDEYIEIPDDLRDRFPNKIRRTTDFSQIQVGKRDVFQNAIPREIREKVEREGYEIRWPLSRSMERCIENGYEFVTKKAQDGKPQKIKVDAKQSFNGQAEYHIAMKIKKEFIEFKREREIEATLERRENRKTSAGVNFSKEEDYRSNPYFSGAPEPIVEKCIIKRGI